MRIIIQPSYVLSLFLLLLFSCSKDDNNQIVLNGGEVFRYQAVTIVLNNVDLNQDEYQGTLGGVPITVAKSDENSLVFAVAPDASLGNVDLVISALNNLTVHYEVKQTVLADTPEIVLTDFVTNLDSYTQAVGVPSIPEYTTSLALISAFNDYYSNASFEEKEEMAKIYQANKTSFDYILNMGISGLGKFSNIITIAEVARGVFIATVAGIVLGTALLAAAATFPMITAIVAGVALGLAAENLIKFTTTKFKAIKLSVANFIGINDKAPSSTFLSFSDNISSVLPISTYRRTIITNDSSSENVRISAFFSAYSRYSSKINLINQAINTINNYNPFYDIPTVSVRLIPVSSLENQEGITSEIFNNLTLTVSNPNLKLMTGTLASTGQINIKIKIIGTPTSLPFESFLNYSYSDEYTSFSGKLPISVNNTSCGNVTDIDGNVYSSVSIGTQCWMQSNLNVARYRNGDVIPQVQDEGQWNTLTTGAWCYYENNTANGTVYGKLYNWYAVNDPRGLAPTGYHVASDGEWTTLTTFLGGVNVAGNKMKATTGWTPYSGITNTNSSGFTGLPGGYRYDVSIFTRVGDLGAWWSSTGNGTNFAWARFLQYNDGTAVRFSYKKQFGFSVRCLKD